MTAPRPAATVLLVRDAADAGVEVLMLARRLDSGFVPGAWVFPGGALDPADHRTEVHACSDGPDAGDRLAHRVAAVRETFEEAGVLLATGPGGEDVPAPLVDALQVERHRLEVGQVGVDDLCRHHRLRLATATLRPFAHWITPEGAPRRYDTRFFLAPAPVDQTATPCGREATSAHWVRPAEVLERHRDGEVPLILPTSRCLTAIADFASTGALLAAVDQAVGDGPRWRREAGGTRLDLPPPEERAA